MRYAIFISAIVLVFCSCGGNSKKELQVLHTTFNSLERSSKTIMFVSEDIRQKISKEVNQLSYRNWSFIYNAKASSFSKLSSSVIIYINQLKSQLVAESGKDMDLIFSSGNFKSVKKIFIAENKGKELYAVLKVYADSVRKIDLESDRGISNQFKTNYDYFDSSINSSKEFVKTFFEEASAASVLLILAKFENDVSNTENQFVTYCSNMMSPGCILKYEKFQAIIGQSSNCVKTGDDLEIIAGIGSFSTAAMPAFSVDGKVIESNVDGVMTYKFKTSSKAGEYSKPVKIEYYKPDGTIESKEYNIQYTVIDPK